MSLPLSTSLPQDVMAAAISHIERMAPYLDRQLLLPHWSRLSDSPACDPVVVYSAIWRLICDTPMTAYAIVVAEQLASLGLQGHDITPVKESFARIEEMLNKPGDVVSRVISTIDSEMFKSKMRDDDRVFNASLVETQCGFSQDLIALFLEFGKASYAVRAYDFAAHVISGYTNICTLPDKLIEAHWGLVAAKVLSKAPESALDPFEDLIQLIESRAFSSLGAKLTQQAWLLHWSLYVYLQHEDGPERILSLFLKPTYLNTVETVCPWLLRYLVAASALTSKNTVEVAALCAQESHQLGGDPFCRVYENLFVKVDFEAVGIALCDLAQTIDTDHFLADTRTDLTDALHRVVLVELSRLYTQLPVARVREFLGLPEPSPASSIVPADVEDDLAALRATLDEINATVVKGKTDTGADVVVFKAAVQARHQLQEKLDLLAHRAKSITGAFYKRPLRTM